MTHSADEPSQPISNQLDFSPRRSMTGLYFLYFLFLLLASALAGLSFYTHLRLSQQQAQFIQQTTALHQQEKSYQRTVEEVGNVQQKISSLNDNIHTLMQKPLEAEHWQRLEARYYLELAAINASWSDNPQATMTLLHQADQILHDQHDHEVVKIRQAIAQEFIQNAEIKTLDVAGLLTQIDSIQRAIASLPIKQPTALMSQAPALANNQPTSKPNWRAHLQHSLEQLQKLVVIRHHDEAQQEMFTPAFQAMLLETIRLNLQAAQWAVMQRNQAVYQLTLQQAISNIQRGFNLQAPVTEALLKQLHLLSNTNLSLNKPQSGEALQLLNQLISREALVINDLTPAHGGDS